MIRRKLLRNVIVTECSFCSSAKENLYSNTVLLPKTSFPSNLSKKNLPIRDENMQKHLELNDLYEWQQNNLTSSIFVLHDGPPYANGVPHMGHAINKILKDTILRYKIIKGSKVNYIPGWDCHGLPIELKALENCTGLSAIDIRKKARNFALSAIEKQKATFKSWGVIGDWKNPYYTFKASYIKNQFTQFSELYKKDLIYRDLKPVYWSPSTQTALAEAELEYNDTHKSPSVYVKFQVVSNHTIFNNFRVFALIWTTTPWTLPSNQAICFNPSISYCLIKQQHSEDVYIIAKSLLSEINTTLNANYEILQELAGEQLACCRYTHPLNNEIMPFLPSSHVTASKGTGLVHCAPAHGPEDFVVGIENKLPIVDIVDDNGNFKSEAGEFLKDKYVLGKGSETVLKQLGDNVVHLTELTHSYPYDWRSKKPIILKASKQWFLDTDFIKSKAEELLDNIQIAPQPFKTIYKTNLMKHIQKRPFWCISRQRKWGVPIPVFYEKDTEKLILNEETIDHLIQALDKYGPDFWWQESTKNLLPGNVFREGCIEKGQDIFDIWFDSGLSWSSVLTGDQIADLYLEGYDQFNGWFLSSLLTSAGLRNQAPFKKIYVHGFAVDGHGRKMSKSLGNVVDPLEIVKGSKTKKPYGVDVLRWWVVCHAFQDTTVSVNNAIFETSYNEIIKIRKTLRFILGTLNDFDDHSPKLEDLGLLDRYMLHRLFAFCNQAYQYIDAHEYHLLHRTVMQFLTSTVSALYFTAIKDRLYCCSGDNLARKDAQFVLLQMFETLAFVIAPIVPHLIEEAFMHLSIKEGATYFNNKSHKVPLSSWENVEVEKIMQEFLLLKKEINQVLGANSLAFAVHLTISESVQDCLIKNNIDMDTVEYDLANIFQVAEVSITKSSETSAIRFHTDKSSLFPCARCRRVQSKKENEICLRCYGVLENLNTTSVEI